MNIMLVDIGLQTRKQNVALQSLLHWLVHLNSMLVIKHERYATPMYDRFMYCWFVYDNFKPSWKLGGLMWNY